MGGSLAKSRFDAAFVVRMIGIVLFAYFFFGFMLLPLSLIHISPAILSHL